MDQIEAIRKMVELEEIEKQLLFYSELGRYAKSRIEEIIARLEEMNLEIRA